MPKIIGQAEQQQALKDITSALKEVATVNAFISTANPTGKYIISFVDESGAKHHCALVASDKDDVDLLVMNYKDQLRGKILQLAEDYRIALDPPEQAMLRDSSTPMQQDVSAPEA